MTGRGLAQEQRPSADSASIRDISPAGLTVATLIDDPALAAVIHGVEQFSLSIGAPIACQSMPLSLARGGTVGRIGVPREAVSLMAQQRVVVAATRGTDPLAPVSRLWRGLQRRADVLADVQQCLTLPGSAAALAGTERDVLLFSQRVVERTITRRNVEPHVDAADLWARAREAAELVYRFAVSERRKVMLVLPVGRGSEAQRLFCDALDREARQQRVAPPRVVKAGLLSALLTGEGGSERWLVASAMPIEELAATVLEAIGDTGPWPVLSLGRDASFYDMPAPKDGTVDPVAVLLVCASMLHRSGRTELSREMMQSLVTTTAALARMRDELGSFFDVPLDAFLDGLRNNWGRMPMPAQLPERRRVERDLPVVAGLRLRIETSLPAATVRDAVALALMPAGLEVASVRSVEGTVSRGQSSFEVRVRSRLGEPELGDAAAHALVRALGPSLRCVAVEPWAPGASSDRARHRTVTAIAS